MERKIKWYSKSVYVDIDTGEIISKSLMLREYIKGKSSKIVQIKENNGQIEYTIECRRNGQTKITFDRI